MADHTLPIGALVLAAGQAQRMGRSKLDLPWPQGDTILGRVLDVLLQAGVDDCLVVTGGHRHQVEKIAASRKAGVVHNPDYKTEEMLTSIEVGLKVLENGRMAGALIMPGDLPLVQTDTVTGLIARWREVPESIWVPSYQHRRGHPILIPRSLWAKLIFEKGDRGLRSFLDHHESRLQYFNVDDPGIRTDIDDPVNYEKLKDNLSA